MRFYRIGKSVQRVGGKGQQRHQYRVDRDDFWPLSGPENRQRAEAELKQQRAQHDVTIERQQLTDIAAPCGFEQRQGDPAHRQHAPDHPQTDNQGSVFGNRRRQRRALHVHMQAHYQPDIQHNVEKVACHQQNHWRTGVLHAQ